MKRARSDEAKAERLSVILDAAAHWFDAVGHDLTLDQVAVTAGLTRTTLYGYASTREEVLILLSARELDTWFGVVNPLLRRCRTAMGIARTLTDTLVACGRLAPLLALCGTVLERNISLDAATSWKQNLHDRLLETGAIIDSSTRSRDGSGVRLLLHTYASLTGLNGVASPPPIAAKAIADAALHGLRIDFETELRVAVAVFASSFLQPAQRKSTS